jgi:hypothetical protein
MNAVAQHKVGLLTMAAAVLLLVGIAAAARVDEHVLPPRGSRAGDTRVTVKTVERALVHWQADNEATCPGDVGVLVEENYLTHPARDAWGHPLRFVCPGAHRTAGADVSSAGADGVFGTADDIRSWEP